MSDLTTCPACQGRGLVPLDQVADIEQAELQRLAERHVAFGNAVEDADRAERRKRREQGQ